MVIVMVMVVVTNLGHHLKVWVLGLHFGNGCSPELLHTMTLQTSHAEPASHSSTTG